MLSTDTFKKHYKQLNTQQREAVDAIEGPVMVVAGPGTGKTQVLTLRIANILQRTDTEPENILALTFTESAAASMKRRLAEIIGSPAYSVSINTFHGFCNDVIKTYPEYFPRIMNSVNITEVEQINIIKEFSEFRVKDILKKINDFKRDGLSPKDAAKIYPHTKNFGVGVYAKYEIELKKQKLYDYNDMILEVLKSLKKNQKLLQILQEKYQYILADEHQDTNDAQNKIIEILMNFHENPNIFVVGDEKQAIYRFQGASLLNFANFKNKYRPRIIHLTKNYRSTQTILDAAHGILPSKNPLIATTKHSPQKISVFTFERPESEAYFLARDIKNKIKGGAAPRQIAILYRNNRDAFLYSEFMEKMKVPHQIESDIDILGDSDIRKIIILLHAVNDPLASGKIISALHVDFFKNEPLEIYKLAHNANKNKVTAFEAMRGLMPKPYGIFSSWITLSRNLNFTDFFQKIIQESGFLANVMRRKDAVEKINKLNSLFEEVKMLARSRKNYSISDFISYLEALEKHGVLIKKTPSLKLKANVRLMTAHRSKGQEFEYVYIAGAADGHWGGGFGQSDDDERRLFYVALTRAKNGITISYAKENELRKEQLKSRFAGEIGQNFLDEKESKKYESEFENNKKILFTPPPSSKGNVFEKEFVKELFLERGLAVTGLNN
ncbi:MAG: ATP-dependent helicase, partial [Patescibacteria group bacterium]